MPEDEAVNQELRARVESVVRPLRAMDGRKDRMREELLAHLRDSYEQERGKHEPATALERTLERFGAPDRLRRELQAAVPWLERLYAYPVPGGDRAEAWERRFSWIRPGESFAHHALRLTLFGGGLGYAIMLLAMVPTWLACVTFNPLAPPQDATLAGALLLGLCVMLVFCLGLFGCILAGHKMAACTGGRSGARVRLLGWAGLCAGCVLATGLAMAGLMSAFVVIVWDASNLLLLIAASLIAPPTALWVMIEDRKSRRRYRDWGRLEIDD
jgi:hypothetical protein